MGSEEALLQKRFIDLSNHAYRRGIALFTDFLSMNELSLLHMIKKSELATSYETFGGYEFAERQMAMFVPDAPFYGVEYPISVLHVQAASTKFSRTPEHRDYLGALVALGVDRCKTGDIIVKGNEAYIFCHERMAEFFQDGLTQVGHTTVKTKRCQVPQEIKEPEFTEIKGSVSSLRCDSIAALCAHQSRSSVSELFRMHRVFVNGRVIESGSTALKEGDILTLRGVGKFIFKGVLSTTKKDRLYVLLLKYGG